MSKLTMHERLPFEEAAGQSLVSTGELPEPQQIRDVVTEAYERYRGNTSGEVADYIPVLANASPDLFGICVVGVRGRMFEIGDVTDQVLDPERLQAVRVRVWCATPSATRRRGTGSA